jgi:epoxyqueuosine reductase QueG
LPDPGKQTKEILEYAKSMGATLAGVADLRRLKGLPLYGGLSLDKFKYAISIAIALPSEAVEMITADDPGMLYAHAYRTINEALDSIAAKVSAEICREGHRALVIPASMRVEQAQQAGHASHKAFAWAAGLGWIGRNAMLTNPDFGSRVRLVTVLTDMPLIAGKPMPNKCGVCRLCVLSCPAKAFTYVPFEVRPSCREEIFNPDRCFEKLLTNKEVLISKHHMVDHAVHICGVCIKVCPYGKNLQTANRGRKQV